MSSTWHAITLAMIIAAVLQDSLTQPLRMGFGVGVSNDHNDEPFLAATASKKISLLEGDHTQLSAKAQLELEPRSNKASRQLLLTTQKLSSPVHDLSQT